MPPQKSVAAVLSCLFASQTVIAEQVLTYDQVCSRLANSETCSSPEPAASRAAALPKGSQGLVLMQLHHGGVAQLALQRQRSRSAAAPGPDAAADGGGAGGAVLAKNWRGLCLDAPAPGVGGGRVQVWTCLDGAATQEWAYNDKTGQLRNQQGACLAAPEGGIRGGRVHLWGCDEQDPQQQWRYDAGTGSVSNAHGLCLDAPDATRAGSEVHIWSCDDANPNQRFVLGDARRVQEVPPLLSPVMRPLAHRVRHRHGLCLDSAALGPEGGRAYVFACLEALPSQQWAFDASSGRLNDHFGACLTAAAPSDGGLRTAPCADGDARQHWAYDEASGLVSSGSGVCLQVQFPYVGGTVAQTVPCNGQDYLLHWLVEELGPAPETTAGAATTAPPATSTTRSASTRPRTTSTTTTTISSSSAQAEATTTSQAPSSRATTAAPGGGEEAPALPLSSVRNCYLAPLETGVGCEQLSVLNGSEFGRNEFGQETSGKAACLRSMRAAGGDSFVFFEGWCEVWQCHSRAVLRASAGTSPVQNFGVLLRSFHGKYLAVEADGHISANGDVVSSSTKFDLVDNDDGTVSLKTIDGQLVTASTDGSLRLASADAAGDRAKFRALRRADGGISLRSFTGLYVTAEQSGVAWASRPQADAWETFDIINRTHATPIPERPAGESWVYSELCEFQEGHGGRQGAERRSPIFVNLWEWSYNDVARECTEFLGPNGFDAVQVSPVAEHIQGTAWWTKYQPISAGLHSRSGTEEEFKRMVAACRAVGVQVMVDILFNHAASPCPAATKASSNTTPCVGWAGSLYGNRHLGGARGWDRAGPEHFHHAPRDAMQCICNVGPATGWLCPNNDCTPCDMYGMPDWNSALPEVRDMHARHVEELHSIGVTMLRIDAALYQSVTDLGSILNRVPWDYVYMEWWGEYPIPERSRYVGHYRDVAYRWKVCNALATKNASQLSDVLQVTSGVFGIVPEQAVYPMLYHDGRSEHADQGIATYKNGLEYHQQQKFLLAWPWTVSLMLWGSYGWTSLEQGPPGCEPGGDPRCRPTPVFDADGHDGCLPTPTESPLPLPLQRRRGWVCEHRWTGVAGLMNFRRACRGLPVTQTWTPEQQESLGLGHVAFRLGEECFAAVVKGYNTQLAPSWGHLGDWSLEGLATGLPEGRYCDVSSLPTNRGWDQRSCPREVVLGPGGVVLSGHVPEGDLLAIYTGSRLVD